MPNLGVGRTSRTLAATLLLSTAPAWVSGSDLTTYRTFKFGADIESVVKQAGVDASRVKVLHTRPALIQQFEWRPGGLGPMTEPDTVKDLVFTFYQGELYQIVVNYDTHGTEGMTTGDFSEAISATYGPPRQARTERDSSRRRLRRIPGSGRGMARRNASLSFDSFGVRSELQAGRHATEAANPG